VTPASELLVRNEHHFEHKRLLVSGAVEDDYAVRLASVGSELHLLTSNYSCYRSLATRLAPQQLTFAGWLEQPPAADAVILYLPKAKAEAEFLLANLTSLLPGGTELWLVGENRGGIRGADKLLAPYGGQINKVDTARRCSLYLARLENPAPPFKPDDWLKRYQIAVAGTELEVLSLPGVFSHGELDQGSRLLLESLPSTLQGRVLDIGCGAGVISAWLAKRHPGIELEATDISALALASTRMTLAANGVNGRVFASDVYSDVPPPGHDWIISNPPFHAGLKTHYDATETLLSRAPAYLNRQGQLQIVANRFLRYPPLIEAAFGHCDRVCETGKFRVYHATRSS